MTVYLASSGVVNAIAAAWYVRRWSAARQTRGSLFAWFSLSVALWSAAYAVWLCARTAESAKVWASILLIPAGFIGPCYFHMAARLLGRAVERFAVVGYVLGVINVVCVVSGASVDSVAPLFEVPFWPRAGNGFIVFLATYAVFTFGAGLMAIASARSIGHRKEALRLHSIVSLGGILIGFANLPGWFSIAYPPWSNLLVAPYLAGSSYTFAMLFPGHKRSRGALTILAVLAVAATLSMVTVLIVSWHSARMPAASTWLLLAAYHGAALAVCYFVFSRVNDYETRPWASLTAPLSHLMATAGEIERELPSWGAAAGTRICQNICAALEAEGVAAYISEDGERLQLAGAYSRTGSADVADIAPGVLVEECARGNIVGLKWLGFAGDDRWLARWRFALPVVMDRQVAFILLIQAGRSRYANEVLRELHAVAFRVYVMLYTRRLARQFVTQESLLRLGQLAAGIAHEVRTPLTSIKTYVELMHSGQLDPRSEKSLYAEVDAGLERIVGAIEAVSAYADQRSSERAPVALDGVVEQTRAMCATELRRQRVTLTNELPPHAVVYGNRRELLQVFANLIQNAIEALAPLGGGTIEVEYEPLAGARSFRVKVKDSGPGLPAHIQARLGQPFQTTKTQKHEAGRRSGYGLGLSIVLDRITAHGGTLDYHDHAFVLTFPAQAVKDNPDRLVVSR